MKYEIYYEYPNRNGDTCFQKRFDSLEEAKEAYSEERAGFIQNTEGKVLKRYTGVRRGGRREGAGRPSQYDGEKKAINLKLTTDAIELLTEQSRKTNVSRSDIINKLIFDNLR